MIRMFAAALACLALVAAGCGASTAFAQPIFVATTCGQPPLAKHPRTISFSCDGNLVLLRITWTNWGHATAAGTATLYVKDGCIPDCASAPVYTYPARVVASQVALCRGNRRVYGLVVATILNGTDFRGKHRYSNRLLSCV
jgi:hypothetical protein